MHRFRDSRRPLRVSRSMRSTASSAPPVSRPRSPSTLTCTPWPFSSSISLAMYSSSSPIRAEISLGGRCQFSSENANSVSTSTPASIAPSTASRTDVIPARWPSGRGSRRSRAQRPLPSMMMATWRGTAPLTLTCPRRSSGTSDLHDLGFFGLHRLLDQLQVIVVELLHVLFRVLLVVLGDVLGLLDAGDRLRPRVADGHVPVLRELVYDFDQLAAPVLGERRQRNADEVAVVGGVEPQVGREDRLLDRLDQRFVPGLHGEELGLGGRHARHLVQRHLVPVRFHLHEIEERRRRLPGPHGRELALHRFHRLVHGLLRLPHVVLDRGHWTMVPTRSPARIRAVAPGWLMLNTTMGSEFSLHSPNALASITAYPLTRASWKV